LSDIRDARLDLEEPLLLGEAAPAKSAPVRVAWLAAAFATATAVLLAIPTIMYFRQAPPSEIRVEVTTPSTTNPMSFAISPDGRRLVFSASKDGQSQLWVR